MDKNKCPKLEKRKYFYKKIKKSSLHVKGPFLDQNPEILYILVVQ
jgi:hypothetical protein